MKTVRDPQILFFYVGTYTKRESFVNGIGEGIYVFRLDRKTGTLTFVSKVTGITNPSYFAIDPKGAFLYAVNEITGMDGEAGKVSAFAMDPVSGELTFVNQQSVHGLSPCHLSIAPGDRYLLVANYESGSLCVLPLLEDGSLAEATDVVYLQGSGPDPLRQEGSHAHMIISAPGSNFIYVVDLGADSLLVYQLDKLAGKLLPVNPPSFRLPAGAGPRHLVFHPHNLYAYIVNELHSSVTVFRTDQTRVNFKIQQTVSTLPDGFEENNLGAEIQISPSGKFIYASNRGHDSIAIFAIDLDSGELVQIGHVPTQGITPRYFTIDPTGEYLFVANQDSHTIVTFQVNQGDGFLTPTGQVVQVPSPVCIKIY